MKKTTYSGKSKTDLTKILYEKREAIKNVRFSTAGSKSRNVKELSTLRKEVARIMTELNKEVVGSKK